MSAKARVPITHHSCHGDASLKSNGGVGAGKLHSLPVKSFLSLLEPSYLFFFIGSNHSLFTAWRGASRVVGMVTAEVDCHARAHVCMYVKVSWKLLSTFSSQFHPSSHELLKKEQEQEALLKRLARNGFICYEIVSFLYVWNQ